MESGGKHPFSILHFGLVLSETLPINYYFIIFHVNIILAYPIIFISLLTCTLRTFCPGLLCFYFDTITNFEVFYNFTAYNTCPKYYSNVSSLFSCEFSISTTKLPITHASGQTNVWHSFIGYIHHNYCWKISFPLQKKTLNLFLYFFTTYMILFVMLT